MSSSSKWSCCRKNCWPHPQYHAISTFGKAVNITVNLCDMAPRNRNVLILNSTFKQQLNQNHLQHMQIEKTHNIGKASVYSAAEDSVAYFID